MITAAVTGAAGFIGSHLVERLAARGYHVRALGHANAESRLGNLLEVDPLVRDALDIRLIDVLDPSDLEAAFEGVQVVFHLAAQISVPYSFRAPTLFVQANIGGTLNVLTAAQRCRVGRVVVLSSSEVYGGAVDEAMPETQVLQARSPYAASKIAAEKLAQAWWHSYGLPTVMVRPFNTFGPRQSPRAVIPWIVRQALSSGTITLGNTDTRRDLVFVTDTADGLIAAAEAEGVEGEVFNLASGSAVSIGELVDRVSRLVGRPLTVTADPGLTRDPSREVWTLIGDAAAAASRLGWRPTVSLDDGLSRVIAHIASRSGPDVAGWSTIASRA